MIFIDGKLVAEFLGKGLGMGEAAGCLGKEGTCRATPQGLGALALFSVGSASG